ncbi:MAG: PPE family protein [Mycobacteriaceae bacterium]|nr:PPE family protein [Mycobacteriaceae bacterium]
MDYGVLPPEVNSGLMYAGPGSGSMIVAATAWDELAAVLSFAASGYGSVLAGLTHESWLGPASASMAAATAPYAVWLRTMSVQAEQAATQAKMAAAAFEEAFAMTVPPPLIAANRAQLMSLVATNVLGQNSSAIEALQAEYAEMWAQDAAAMYSYAGAAQAASALTPFAQPVTMVDPAGLVAPGAAVGMSAVNGVETNVPAVLGQLGALAGQTLSGGVAALPAASVTVPTPIGELDVIAAYIATISTFNLAAATTTAVVNVARPWGANGVNGSGAAQHEEDGGQDGENPADRPAAETDAWVLARSTGGGAAIADVGQAATLGSLSVPHSWTMAAPEIKLAVEALPSASVDATPPDAGGAPAGLLSGMALASLAGRGITAVDTRRAGGTGPEKEGQLTRKPTVVVIHKLPPAGGSTGRLQ